MSSKRIEHIEYFGGYLAEQIRLQAESQGMTPEKYGLSLFETRHSAPRRKTAPATGVSFRPKGAMHPPAT